MLKRYFGCILLGLFFGCTDATVGHSSKSENTVNVIQEKRAQTNKIPVYKVVFDTSVVRDNLLYQVSAELEVMFQPYAFHSTSDELNERKEMIRKKHFPKSLSADFGNQAFEAVGAIDFTEISPKQSAFESIRLEQWTFKTSEMAASCFESLTTYEDKELHFMTINWIWLQQGNILFLISSQQKSVSAAEMQKVKGAVMTELKKRGTYRSVQYYE